MLVCSQTGIDNIAKTLHKVNHTRFVTVLFLKHGKPNLKLRSLFLFRWDHLKGKLRKEKCNQIFQEHNKEGNLTSKINLRNTKSFFHKYDSSWQYAHCNFPISEQ